MKKYIKPEIEIVSFDVESAVMAALDDPTATQFPVAVIENLSALNTQYIPESVDKKVWSTMDDENWNWE